MSTNYNASFKINPPIKVRVIEADHNIDMSLGLEIAGTYSYFIADEIAFYHQGIDLNNSTKKAEFEGRLLQSMHCTMSLFWSEKVSRGVRHEEIPELFDEMKAYIVNDLRGGFCMLTGISLVDMEFKSSRISPEDENKYRECFFASASEADNKLNSDNVNQDTIMAHRMPPKTKFKWECPCGRINETSFCPGCGRPKDATSVYWICDCGKKNNTRFCTNCGNRRE